MDRLVPPPRGGGGRTLDPDRANTCRSQRERRARAGAPLAGPVPLGQASASATPASTTALDPSRSAARAFDEDRAPSAASSIVPPDLGAVVRLPRRPRHRRLEPSSLLPKRNAPQRRPTTPTPSQGALTTGASNRALSCRSGAPSAQAHHPTPSQGARATGASNQVLFFPERSALTAGLPPHAKPRRPRHRRLEPSPSPSGTERPQRRPTTPRQAEAPAPPAPRTKSFSFRNGAPSAQAYHPTPSRGARARPIKISSGTQRPRRRPTTPRQAQAPWPPQPPPPKLRHSEFVRAHTTSGRSHHCAHELRAGSRPRPPRGTAAWPPRRPRRPRCRSRAGRPRRRPSRRGRPPRRRRR